MTKSFMMEDLDCANCARKMEDLIRKIDGVEEIHVNFLTQKMILTADDDRFDAILKEAVKQVRKIDPDCSVLL